MGHVSKEEKQHLLGNFTRDNREALQRRMAQEESDRNYDIEFANNYIRRENDEATRIERIMQQMNQNKQMTLKERLIAQKQERLNQQLLNRQEEKRPILTSIPFNEAEKKKPANNGIFYKYTHPATMTDAFKRLSNPDIEKMKKAHVKATNLGPGVP